MAEPISYAMRNTEALSHWLNFNAPSELKDWSFLAIEFILVVGTICTILHAVRHYKKNGNHSALLTLLGAFGYGLLCDIASYYTVENFWHGEFSVMLVYNRLPLYIVLFYPVVIYHICMPIRRYEFSRTVETISTAFYAGLTPRTSTRPGCAPTPRRFRLRNPASVPFAFPGASLTVRRSTS